MIYLLFLFFSLLILLDIPPLHKILVLIILYLLGSYVLIILDNYYLGLTYIIIYIGAIAILFLFVFMMMNLHSNVSISSLSLILLFLFLSSLVFLSSSSTSTIFSYSYINYYYSFFKLYDIHLLSILLFSNYSFYIILLGLILWTILLGILGLGKLD